MGVVSTLNAGAEQIPTPPAAGPDPAVAAADEATLAPPPVLPWGEKPKKLKIGKAGSSSRALAAAGADAALPEPGDKLVVEPEFAPKGDVDFPRARRSARKVAPPAPPGLTAKAKAGPNYFYAGTWQKVPNHGSYANLVISKPTVQKEEYHSIGEIAVQGGGDQNQDHTVEVGWTVNRTMHGDDEPHLFVYHWVDKQETCYNACGFVPVSKTIVPGMTLPSGVQKRFGIEYYKGGDGRGAWWIAYDSEWVGYYPDTLWRGRFTSSGLVQWYGEVASTRTAPCGTEMGNGKPADDAGAARIGTITLLGPPGEPAPDTVLEFEKEPQNPYYTIAPTKEGSRTVRFGGDTKGRGACP